MRVNRAWLHLPIFATVFVFLFQTFFYVKEVEAVYLLSKAVIPAVGALLSLVLLMLVKKHANFRSNSVLALICFVPLFFGGALTSMSFYGQATLEAATSQAKVLPIFYYFVASAFLYYFQPSPKTLRISLIGGGLLLLLVFYYAAIKVNVAEHWTPESSILVNDAKGFRIRFPSGLLVLSYFLILHSFRYNRSPFYAACLILYLYFFAFELKQRTEFVSVLAASIIVFLPKKYLLPFGLFIGTALAGVVLFAQHSSFLREYLDFGDDTSWLARARQIDYVMDIIEEHPLTIFFGVGKLTEIGDFGYESLLGFKFTTADLGWLGVLHEYGVFGIALVLCIVYWIFRTGKRIDSFEDIDARTIISSIRSYLVMSLILSAVATRFLYLSGLYFSLLAISAYLIDLFARKSHLEYGSKHP